MKARRKYLTPKERADMFALQGGLCACGCDNPLGEKFIAEHWVCVALGNDAKPDSLLRLECAARKTKRDIKDIAKVKRIRKRLEGRQRPKKQIRSRPFDKRLRKRMDGSVVRVTP